MWSSVLVDWIRIGKKYLPAVKKRNYTNRTLVPGTSIAYIVDYNCFWAGPKVRCKCKIYTSKFRQVFSSFKQKLIHLPTVYWLTHSLTDSLTDLLTHSLICPHNALISWQRCKNHTLVMLLQGFRQLSSVTWPTLHGGKTWIMAQCSYHLKGDMGIEVKNP